jgi:hypothetical protein
METAKEYWKRKFDEYPQNDSEKLAVAMMQEYAQEVVKNLNIPAVSGRSEQLKAFVEFCADNYSLDIPDRVIKDFEQSL